MKRQQQTLCAEAQKAARKMIGAIIGQVPAALASRYGLGYASETPSACPT